MIIQQELDIEYVVTYKINDNPFQFLCVMRILNNDLSLKYIKKIIKSSLNFDIHSNSYIVIVNIMRHNNIINNLY